MIRSKWIAVSRRPQRCLSFGLSWNWNLNSQSNRMSMEDNCMRWILFASWQRTIARIYTNFFCAWNVHWSQILWEFRFVCLFFTFSHTWNDYKNDATTSCERCESTFWAFLVQQHLTPSATKTLVSLQQYFTIFQRRALARTHIYCSTENIFFSFSWNILSYFFTVAVEYTQWRTRRPIDRALLRRI